MDITLDLSIPCQKTIVIIVSSLQTICCETTQVKGKRQKRSQNVNNPMPSTTKEDLLQCICSCIIA